MNKRITSGYPLIINYLGIFLVLIGFINLIPLVLIPFHLESVSEAYLFLIPGLSSVILGFLIVFAFKGRENGRLERHQDASLVV